MAPGSPNASKFLRSMLYSRNWRAGTLAVVEDEVPGALPEGHLSEGPEVLEAGRYGQEMVAGKLAEFAGEAGGAVGEEDLRLRVAPWVEKYLPRGGVARGVLETDPEVEVSQRDPTRLPTPADVDDPLPVRQQPLESLATLGTLLPLPARLELVWP